MDKLNNYGNEKEYDEFDFAYEQAIMMVHAIEEVRALRKENQYLKEELLDRDKSIQNQFKQTSEQLGGILVGLIDKAEKEMEENQK